jgi:hypothetical protein
MTHSHSQQALSRRSFLKATASTLFAGVAISLTRCSASDPVSAPVTDTNGIISSNHGHQAVVTKADIEKGGTVILSIKGEAPHLHTITLTASDVVNIKSGARVMKNSTLSDDHSHSVTFN